MLIHANINTSKIFKIFYKNLKRSNKWGGKIYLSIFYKERSMIRRNLKRMIALAMSVAVGLTAAPGLKGNFSVRAEAATEAANKIVFGNYLENASLGREITASESTVTFKSKTDSNVDGNYKTPALVIYYGDENAMYGDGYEEVAIIRSDVWKNSGNVTFNVDSRPADWGAWLYDNKQGVDVSFTTKIVDGTASVVFENDGAKTTTTFPVKEGKKLYVSVSGEGCEVSGLPDDMVNRYYGTDNSFRYDGWWSEWSFGDEVTESLKTVDFTSKSFLYADKNFHTPSLVVYYGDKNSVSDYDYEEVAIIRSDAYAYFYGDAANKNIDKLGGAWNDIKAEFTRVKTPENWGTWVSQNKQGVDISFTSQIKDGRAVITLSNNGVKTETSFKADTTKKLHISVTGEKCRVSGLPDSMMKLQENSKTDDAELKEISSSDVAAKYSEYFGKNNKKSHVTVHDPSVVLGYTDSKYTGDRSQTVYGEQNKANSRKKVYFIFGSHRAFAWSTDMQNWEYFKNNINDDDKCQELFKSAFEWAAKGDSKYDWTGNLWAPDVIWNKQMNKWCMYMSINGNTWNSSIVLLTSDSLNGDWKKEGTVVYSGFAKSGVHTYTETDFEKVVGSEKVDNDIKRFILSDEVWNFNYGAHAIDPCVTYDSEGNLWMSYGSWSGGIWLIRLDGNTGFRDEKTTYSYEKDKTDPYMGYKLTGGNMKSGEASYIEKIGGKYYLFVSYGGFSSTGGYNIRVFSADDITGPYKDVSETDAANVGGDSLGNGTNGERLMAYYRWSFMDKGSVAQGHNSAIVDDDGKAYLVYHTRFDDGTEGHEVRVHQLFTAANGALVTAPFEYSGETLSKKAYDTEEIIGEYSVLLHETKAGIDCRTEKKIKLRADGKITGAYTGSWSQAENSPAVTIKLGNASYEGVFIKQKIDDTGYETMCFTTAADNNMTFWGTKGYTDEINVIKDASEVSVLIPANLYSDIQLPTSAANGSKIIWNSSDEKALSSDGKIGTVAKDTDVALTMTVKCGEYFTKKTYSTVVKSYEGADYETGLAGNYMFENGLRNEVDTNQVGEAKALENGVKPSIVSSSDRDGKVLKQNFGYAAAKSISYTQFENPLRGKSLEGVTVALWVNRNDTDVWDTIWSFFDEDASDGKSGRTYLTPNAYLGYNGTVSENKWFDCNHSDTVTNFIKEKEWHHVTVSLGTDNFGIYVDGKLVSSKTANAVYKGTAYEDAAQDMLSVIASSENFYLGYGSWWGSAPLLMDNVRIYGRELSAADVGALYSAEKKENADIDDSEEQKGEYTVKFNPNFNDSGLTEKIQKFTLGSSQKLDVNSYVREGYIFKGWSKTSTGEVEFTDAQEITSDLAKENEEIVLYAVWQKNESTGSSTGNTGSGTGNTGSGTGSIGSSTGSTGSSTGSGSNSSVTSPGTAPTAAPTVAPTAAPTVAPTVAPTAAPTVAPTAEPTKVPSAEPTKTPTTATTAEPTKAPTTVPTAEPTKKPASTKKPSTKKKKMSVKKVTANKNAKKITGTLSVTGAKVTVKVGNAKAKKATVKGKTFTFKFSKKLKKNTKIVITITKSKYYTVKKTIKVK